MERATSFGSIAEDYDRYRPAPPVAVADWLLPDGAERVADVCAGTGGFSRVLATRVDQVLAVDLDQRMLAVAATGAVTPVRARGEELPVPDASLDAVTVSSGWHWLDPDRAVPEIARVLRPGGVLGVVWNGPARGVDWVAEILGRDRANPPLPAMQRRELRLPAGEPFAEPETEVVHWSLPRTPSELMGLAGTYSRFITLGPSERRHRARRAAAVIEGHPALRDRARIDLPMSSRCWRAVRR